MTSILMLDTDIVSYLVKERRPSIRPRFLEHDPAELCVSAVTKSELLYGLRLLESTHDLHLKVRRFLGDIDVAPWDGDAAEVHANMRHHLISTGRTIGEMDMMIAAHAMSLVRSQTRWSGMRYHHGHASPTHGAPPDGRRAPGPGGWLALAHSLHLAACPDPAGQCRRRACPRHRPPARL